MNNWACRVSVKENEDYIVYLGRKLGIYCHTTISCYGDYDLHMQFMGKNYKGVINFSEKQVELYQQIYRRRNKKQPKLYWKFIKYFKGVDVWFELMRCIKNR